MFDMKNRKGITPVIAIVLLLMVTVGAVGVVYTQFQSLVGNPDEAVGQQQDIQNTEMAYATVYDNSGEISIQFRNTGSVTWNTSDFNMQFIPGGEGSAVSYTATTGQPEFSSAGGGSLACFEDDSPSQTIDPGDSYECDTGLSFPEATQTLGIVVSMNAAEKSWRYSCSPETGSAVGC